jgi:hypothetical protein
MIVKEEKLRDENVYVEIVFKHSNDSLQLATMTFEVLGFIIRDENKAEICRHKYTEITLITMRARPFHCDLGLTGGSRIRLCASGLQSVVNELSVRSVSLPVVFEYNSIKFDYGDRILREKAREEYSYIASKEVREGFKKQDQQLDSIEHTAKQLQHMGLDIGDELDESTVKIRELQHHTDEVGKRVATTNARVVRLL